MLPTEPSPERPPAIPAVIHENQQASRIEAPREELTRDRFAADPQLSEVRRCRCVDSEAHRALVLHRPQQFFGLNLLRLCLVDVTMD